MNVKSLLKKVTIILLFLSLLMSSLPEVSSAASSGEWKVNANILNVRQKAGSKYRVVGKLKNNQVVTVTYQKKGWSKIKAGSIKGWVSTKYIKYTVWKGYVKSDSLNLRVDKSSKSKVIMELPKGSKLKVKKKVGNWYRVYVYGKKVYGWVHSKYVTNQVVLTDAKAPSMGDLYVKTKTLRIWSKSKYSSNVLFVLDRNTKVQLIEKKGAWAKVRYSKKKIGWAKQKFLKDAVDAKSSDTSKDAQTGDTKEEKVIGKVLLNSNSNIRSGSGTNYSVLTVEKAGARLDKLAVKSGWVKVKTSNGKIGWVADWLTVPLSNSGSLKEKVIVLDPGHGGKDPGAGGKTTLEKVINLQTALEIEKLLKNAGATVMMTRDNDVYLTLAERVAISHKYKPDMFISVHYNAAASKTANGIMTFYYTNSKDYQLANSLQAGLVSETNLKNQGVRYGNFHVLRENKYPSVLLELGFLSNPNEENIIATNAYHKKAAKGVMKGIEQYFK